MTPEIREFVQEVCDELSLCLDGFEKLLGELESSLKTGQVSEEVYPRLFQISVSAVQQDLLIRMGERQLTAWRLHLSKLTAAANQVTWLDRVFLWVPFLLRRSWLRSAAAQSRAIVEACEANWRVLVERRRQANARAMLLCRVVEAKLADQRRRDDRPSKPAPTSLGELLTTLVKHAGPVVIVIVTWIIKTTFGIGSTTDVLDFSRFDASA